MSIRIAGQPDVATVDSSRATTAKSSDTDAKVTTSVVSGEGSDHADISNAAQLVALAKTLTPAGKEQTLASLSARVNSGQYRPDAAEISRAIVQGLLKK